MAILPSQNRSPQQAGSGFTNLSRYLQANKQNQLGQAVSSGVQQAGQQARGAINQAGQQFKTEAEKEKERLGQQEQRVSNVLGNVSNATDDDVKQFESIRGAQSLGPKGIVNADELRSKAGEAETLGRAGGSEAGRFGLLQRFVGGGNPYTVGQQRLDQMLLGQTGQQQLRSARAGTLGLTGQAEQQIGGAAAQGQELQGEARKLAESTVGKLGQSVTDYDAAMQAQLASKTAAINDLISRIVTPGSNAPIELEQRRIDQLKDVSDGVLGDGSQLFNADLSPYLTANQLYATKQGAQSTEDFAKAQMLAKLSGESLAGQDAGNILQDYVMRPELAGSYDANNPFAVSSQADLAAAINKQKSGYESGTSEQNTLLQNLQNSLSGKYSIQDALGRGAAYGSADAGLYGKLGSLYAGEQQKQAKAAYLKSHPGMDAKTLENMIRMGQNPVGTPNYSDAFSNTDSIKSWAANQNPNILNTQQFLDQILAAESGISTAKDRLQALPQEFQVLRALKAIQPTEGV